MPVCVLDPECWFLHWYLRVFEERGISVVTAINPLLFTIWLLGTNIQTPEASPLPNTVLLQTFYATGRPCKIYTGWLHKAGLGWLNFFPSKLSFQNVSGNNKVSLRNLISCKANMSMKVSSNNLEGPSCRKSTVLTIMKGTQVLCTGFFFFAIHNKIFTQSITHVHGPTAYM